LHVLCLVGTTGYLVTVAVVKATKEALARLVSGRGGDRARFKLLFSNVEILLLEKHPIAFLRGGDLL
jgi:hypothetical protein